MKANPCSFLSVSQVEVNAVITIVCSSSPTPAADIAYGTPVIMQPQFPGVQWTRMHLPCAQYHAQGHSPMDLCADFHMVIYCVLLGGFLKFSELSFPTRKMGMIFYIF